MKTRAELTAAIAVLEEIEQLRNFRTFPLDCAIYLRCKYRAQLAALPEPAHKAYATQVGPVEWICRCKCGWIEKFDVDGEGAGALCELHDSKPAQPWTPRERRLREALEALLGPEIVPDKDGLIEDATCFYCHCSTIDGCDEDCPVEIARAALADTPPPDPRDEALELMEVALVEYLERRYLSLDSASELLAAIRAARGTK